MRPVSLRIRSSVGKRGSGGNFLSFFNENAITRELPLKAAICLSGKSDDFAYLPITRVQSLRQKQSFYMYERFRSPAS